MRGFTAEELAEMAAADAEIEREFRLTQDDFERSAALDRVAAFEAKTPEQQRVAAYHRAYNEANREKVAAYHRAYYEANREKLAVQQKVFSGLRRERELTQGALAKLLNVSQPTISRWERGMVPADLDALERVFLDIRDRFGRGGCP